MPAVAATLGLGDALHWRPAGGRSGTPLTQSHHRTVTALDRKKRLWPRRAGPRAAPLARHLA